MLALIAMEAADRGGSIRRLCHFARKKHMDKNNVTGLSLALATSNCGKTLVDLAKAVGISQSRLSQYLAAEGDLSKHEERQALLMIELGLDPDDEAQKNMISQVYTKASIRELLVKHLAPKRKKAKK